MTARGLGHAALVLACSVVVTACIGHATTMRDVRDALHHEDLVGARARLADAGRGTDDLLFALEDGLLLHYLGDYEQSNLRLALAEERIADLYTKSITRAALSLATSDLVLRFEPHGVETHLVNYYRALNYLYMGERQEASVEWRKLAYNLQFARQEDAPRYVRPPFLDYLVGLGLEEDDPGAAYVAFRNAEAGYREAGAPTPPDLVSDLARLASDLGFSDHLDTYARRYGHASGGTVVDSLVPRGPKAGEIVVLIEDGFVAPIEEARAYVPIFEGRVKRATGSREARTRLARVLASEYADGRYHRVRPGHVDRDEIAYVLPLAFPYFGEPEPAVFDPDVIVGDRHAGCRVGLDVTALQRAAFEDRLTGIYIKTILRALLKFTAAEKIEEEAEKKHGETAGDIAGILANAVSAVTERADTRAWLGLPHRLWIARVRVTAGEHEVWIRSDGAPVSLGVVRVRPGARVLVSYRFF